MTDGVSAHRHKAAEYFVKALERNRFVLYCQPIVRVASPSASYRFVEVLVRFRDEEEALIPPGTFIPVLEEAKLLALLDRWVLGATIRALWAVMTRAVEPLPRCSLNLSADAVLESAFAPYAASRIAHARVPADRFCFELPLRFANRHPAEFRATVGKLTQAGCSVAVTEVSEPGPSLAPLRDLGVTMVKINAMNALRPNPERDAVVKLRALCQECHGLGMEVVAEYVEWGEALGMLTALDVEYAQGFGIGQPVSLAEALHLPEPAPGDADAP